MRTRIIIGGFVLASTAGIAIPTLAAPTQTVPPACVVVNGPNGVTVQAGYAPNGPADCTQLP